MATKCDWVYIEINTGDWVCDACGERYKMNMPCAITVMSAAMKAFLDVHKSCATPAYFARKVQERLESSSAPKETVE